MNQQRPPRPSADECDGRILSDSLWTWICRCWAHSPEDRPDIAEVLEYFNRSSPVTTVSSRLISRQASRAATPRPREELSGTVMPGFYQPQSPTTEPTSPENTRISFPVSGGTIIKCFLATPNHVSVSLDDASIRAYSRRNGDLVHTLRGHDRNVCALAGNAETLVSGGDDCKVRIWNLETGVCTHMFAEHSKSISCLTLVKPAWVQDSDKTIVAPNQTLVVSGSQDNFLMVWNLPRRDDERFFSPLDNDGYIRAGTRNPFKRRRLADHNDAVTSVAAHGWTVVSGSFDGTVKVWDLRDTAPPMTLRDHKEKVVSVAYDHSHNRAYSGSISGIFFVWDTSQGTCLRSLPGPRSRTTPHSLTGYLAISPSLLLCGNADGTVNVWYLDEHVLFTTLGTRQLIGYSPIKCIAHNDLRVFFAAGGSASVMEFGPEVDESPQPKELLNDVEAISHVALDGKQCIAAYFHEGELRIDIWYFPEWEFDTSQDSTRAPSVITEAKRTFRRVVNTIMAVRAFAWSRIRGLSGGSDVH